MQNKFSGRAWGKAEGGAVDLADYLECKNRLFLQTL